MSEVLTNEKMSFVVPLELTRLRPEAQPEGLQGHKGEEPDDDNRVEYGVTYITSGFVRMRDNSEPFMFIPPDVLQEAVPMFDRLATFIDHANLANFFYPSLKDAAGVTFKPVWNAERKSIDGGWRLSGRPDLEWFRFFLNEFWEDQQAGREVPDIGLSAVIFPNRKWVELTDEKGEVIKRELHLTKIIYVESVDCVFSPGAEGRLREVLTLLGKQTFSIGGQLNMSNDVKNPAAEDTQPTGVIKTPAAVAAIGETPNGTEHVSIMQPNSFGRIETLQAQLHRLSESVNALAAVPETIERLSRLLAQDEEPHVVEGMGNAPRDPAPGRIWGMATSLDRFTPVVEWLFGVDGAPEPDPQFRKADLIYTALTGDWQFTGVFDSSRVMLAGASPTTLPDLAVNAMNKVIVTQFSKLRYWRWYELVTVVTPNDGSLHDMAWITYGGSGNLPIVADGGAYTEGQLADARENDAFTKRGRYIGITRRMIRNSDIQRIQAVPIALATDAIRTRSSVISAIFTDNSGVGPTLDEDSTALFHANHSNVATTALGTDTTAWETASQECFDHTELGSGKKIGVFAKYLLVPSALYFQALSNFGYGDGSPTTYNPFAVPDRSPEDPRPVVLAVPDWTDATDWAYLADPNVWPVIMMSYAQSQGGRTHPMPELFAVTSETGGLMFTNDTMPIKVRDEFAAGVNGAKGIGKRNVA